MQHDDGDINTNVLDICCHSPNGLQAALKSLWWDVFPSYTVDFVRKAETDLKPVIDVKPNNSSCAETENNTVYKDTMTEITRVFLSV